MFLFICFLLCSALGTILQNIHILLQPFEGRLLSSSKCHIRIRAVDFMAYCGWSISEGLARNVSYGICVEGWLTVS